jgi:AcrR family transcriptional regulator
MTDKTQSTHERILGRGLEIVSERGLAGVSLGALAARAELSKSGLFAHFRSKEELQVELLRAAERALGREVVDPAMQEPPGLPRLRALVGRWLGWAERSGLPGGCPLYGAAFELDDAEEGTVRDYLTRSKGEWGGMLAGLVGQAVALGHLRGDVDVEQFVWQLEGIYLAHHVSQRLMRDPEADARAHAAFGTLVASSLPGRAPDPGGSKRATEPTREELR